MKEDGLMRPGQDRSLDEREVAHAIPSLYYLVFLAEDLALALDALLTLEALHDCQLFFLTYYESF